MRLTITMNLSPFCTSGVVDSAKIQQCLNDVVPMLQDFGYADVPMSLVNANGERVGTVKIDNAEDRYLSFGHRMKHCGNPECTACNEDFGPIPQAER